MKILVVAATEAEIAATLAHFNLTPNNFIETEKFDVLITGVGMVATAFALGQKLSSKYNLVLNVGIAGSFDSTIELGELVNITQDTLAELGAEDHENFISLPKMGFGENTFSSFAGITDNLGIKIVKGITVNKVHGNAQSIENVTQLYQPQTESMEGAAVLYAAKELNITVLQIRAISNYVEPRNRENWQIGLAMSSLNDWLTNFLHNHRF
ncbi:futalosine hydrolase [Pedobacter xixiisoli]|uniref:Futalosine hydrolase n=1 Tax=Pedobacter xixiisoli TaxID=1476464 RepID=A0A286AED9_9SPHI|nr:futalosine hydrolase [Pedobacter xixiisoli]SOD20266.1 futalosine hydrolase [Pedobacter xixiisoli]